jgi:hypothetical protein
LSVFTQWGMPPFEPNKRKKQKPEHNGEFKEQHGELGEHNGDIDDQHGKHPETLKEELNKETKSACATANTNENKTEQTFETDPYSALDNSKQLVFREVIPAWTEAEIAQVEAAHEMIKEATKKFKGSN